MSICINNPLISVLSFSHESDSSIVLPVRQSTRDHLYHANVQLIDQSMRQWAMNSSNCSFDSIPVNSLWEEGSITCDLLHDFCRFRIVSDEILWRIVWCNTEYFSIPISSIKCKSDDSSEFKNTEGLNLTRKPFDSCTQYWLEICFWER